MMMMTMIQSSMRGWLGRQCSILEVVPVVVWRRKERVEVEKPDHVLKYGIDTGGIRSYAVSNQRQH